MSKRDFPATIFVTTDPNEEAVRKGLLAHRYVEAAYDEPVGTTMEMGVYALERVIHVIAEPKTIKSLKP